ncbi:MAG: type II toxin-antitoxin system VapC family toxin [Bifidobacteriaceae bacterium]|nr:type II toxin-antitoxin system VapC family toxin [Bifidobacteriaceae bacterium]
MGRPAIKVTVDTNVLVRAAIVDHSEQSQLAAQALQDAHTVALPLPVLCEFVWVLRRGYGRSTEEITEALDQLLADPKVVYDEPVVEYAIAFLKRGGDFADGVIAYLGSRLGAEEFVTFDRKAAQLVTQTGMSARLLD